MVNLDSMGHPSRGLGNSSALSSMDTGGPAQEDSGEYNISNWDRHNACDVLEKNLSAFFPCFKNLSEAKRKYIQLINFLGGGDLERG